MHILRKAKLKYAKKSETRISSTLFLSSLLEPQKSVAAANGVDQKVTNNNQAAKFRDSILFWCINMTLKKALVKKNKRSDETNFAMKSVFLIFVIFWPEKFNNSENFGHNLWVLYCIYNSFCVCVFLQQFSNYTSPSHYSSFLQHFSNFLSPGKYSSFLQHFGSFLSPN